MTTTLPWFERTRELAITLTRWPSVTGSAGESAFAGQVQALLRRWPAFQAHPEDVWLTPARGGHGAHNVYALIRGSSERTVLLAGHYDTVGTEDYGGLQPLASEPEALTQALRALWDAQPPGEAEALAAADLASGDFLCGRGLLDMKGGVAAGLAVLERYASLPLEHRPGHLLLVATPDEEGRSSGARAVAHDLPGIARRHALRLVAGLNLDATADPGDGHAGRAVYTGTVGKLLLFALVVGRPTHAASPFDGVSAALLAAQLMARLESAPELADGGSDPEAAAPPVCLELRDNRTRYDVTTPGQFWCAFNVLTRQRTPGEVLEQYRALAEGVARDSAACFAQRAEAAGSLNAVGPCAQVAEVLTLGELRARALARAGQAEVERVVREVPSGPDPLRASREVATALVELAGLRGPAIVLGFGALHYPHTQLGAGAEDGRLLAALQTHTADLARERGEQLRLRPCFAGISDMSFLGQAPRPADIRVLAEHTAHPGHLDPLPADALAFPVVNAGPWGRDYHQRLERIQMPYSFGTLPELLWRVTHSMLDAQPNA